MTTVNWVTSKVLVAPLWPLKSEILEMKFFSEQHPSCVDLVISLGKLVAWDYRIVPRIFNNCCNNISLYFFCKSL